VTHQPPGIPLDALAELENIKRALDRSAIVAITDTRGVITSVNDRFCKMSGYAREELVGRTHSVVNSGYHPRGFFADLWRTIVAGEVWEGEIKNRAKDGHEYWVHTTIVPFLDAAGRPERYVSIRFEITARKEAEERLRDYALRLERSNSDLDAFASLAAHDLQEPLRKIQAFADRINTRESSNLSGQGRRYLERLVEATGRMRKLVSAILTLSRVTSHGGETQTLALGDVLLEVTADLELAIEEAKARVEFADLPEVRANRAQIHQLFLNLIGNAIKFRRLDSPPVVVVRVADETAIAGRVSLEVIDNGIGFDERFVERIFKPFQRLHTRTEYDGTGIGLAVCHKIVERHGGSFTVRSRTGSGSTFGFSLPAP
jgi:two-component system sensor kinase FixL